MKVVDGKFRLTDRELKVLLGKVVGESVHSQLEKRSLLEKEKQEDTDAAVDDLFSDDDGSSSTSDEPKVEPKKNNDGSTPPQPDTLSSAEPREGEVDLDMIVDKLNTIRGGRSFDDEAVSIQMKRYFEDLDDAERLALYAFTKGIAQVVSGEVEGDQASEPNDQPNPGLKISKSDSEKKQSNKHVPSSSPVKHKPSKENTASPTPIMPKQR